MYAVEGDTNSPWDPTAMLCAAACHSTVGRTIFEPLAMVGEDGEVVPYLLESITPNDDSTVFTLKLREGIMFHDGTELTADVVAFNFERQRTGLLIGPAIKLIDTIESDGAYTVTVSLSDSWPDFPYSLNSQFGYVGSQVWEEAADADPSLKTEPVGTGPFKFVSYESGENGNLKAERFEDYWRGESDASLTDEGLPYLDGIEVRFMPSGQSRIDALKAGDIDLLQTSDALDIVDLEDADGVVSDALNQPILTETDYLLINQQAVVNDAPNPMADINVRKALAFATDYETLTATRAADLFPIANGPFPEGQDGYLEDNGFPTFDLDAATELVDEYEADNGPLKIAYKTTTDPANLDTAELLKDMWEQAGIEVTLDQIPQGEFIAQAIGGNFQVFGWRNHSGVADQQYVWWTSENTETALPLNFGRIRDPELDALMLTIRTSTDPAEVKQAAEDVNQLFADNVYNIWTNWVYWVLAHGDNVHNVVGQPLPDGDGPQPGRQPCRCDPAGGHLQDRVIVVGPTERAQEEPGG